MMDSYKHAGAMLRAYREQARLSQRVVSIRTELVDFQGKGISVSILSGIENQRRELSPKYLKLLIAANIFSSVQVQRLYEQAAADLIRREFGELLSAPCGDSHS